MTVDHNLLARAVLADATAVHAAQLEVERRNQVAEERRRAQEAERQRLEAERRAAEEASLRRRRSIDSNVMGVAGFAAITLVVPWLIGHFLLRGWFLQEDSRVFDAEIRPILPYFWAELLAGWAILGLLAGAVLALRPWTGRVVAAVLGVVLVIGGFWLASTASSLFDSAEAESVAKLRSTEFPFESRYFNCGYGFEFDEYPTEADQLAGTNLTKWQMYLGSEMGYAGDGCNRFLVYAGWQFMGEFTLRDGTEFQDTGNDYMWVYLPQTNDTYFDSGLEIWAYDRSQVWLNARTTDGRVVSTNLAEAGNGGLAVR
ncbi:hypothetical protein [Rhodococcus sp. 5G237]